MLFKSLLFAVCAVATASCTTHGTFKSPKSESFVTIELYLDRSVNLTTPDGAAALVPIRGGEIRGQFNGFVVQNLTASTERVKFDSEGGEYSTYESTLLWENDDGDRVMALIQGMATYGNNALHGFGYVTLETSIEELEWINYGMFIAEWQADFFSGVAETEIFVVNTGGRKDGAPIPALEPSTSSAEPTPTATPTPQ